MNKIYVNKDNVVSGYMVNIDIKQYLSIIDEIDKMHGRGEVKRIVGKDINKSSWKKVVILSKDEIDDSTFQFEYYEFIPCCLSRTASALLDCSDVFTFSRSLRNLFVFCCYGEKEKEYLNRLKACFSFEKIISDDFLLDDLSYEEEKKGCLQRFLSSLKSDRNNPYVIAMCAEYEEDLLKTGLDSNSNEREKTFVKRRTFESLPRYNQIK